MPHEINNTLLIEITKPNLLIHCSWPVYLKFWPMKWDRRYVIWQCFPCNYRRREMKRCYNWQRVAFQYFRMIWFRTICGRSRCQRPNKECFSMNRRYGHSQPFDSTNSLNIDSIQIQRQTIWQRRQRWNKWRNSRKSYQMSTIWWVKLVRSGKWSHRHDRVYSNPAAWLIHKRWWRPSEWAKVWKVLCLVRLVPADQWWCHPPFDLKDQFPLPALLLVLVLHN